MRISSLFPHSPSKAAQLIFVRIHGRNRSVFEADLNEPMSHAAVENDTPLAFEPLFLSDENGQPILVCVAKATSRIGKDGQLFLSEKQQPVNIVGEPWGKPGKSSYKYEAETALQKLSTDVVLIGDGYARRPGDTQVDVSFR